MNRLDICRQFAVKVGVPTTSFLTTVSPTAAEQQRVVGWVDEAWNEIQALRADWFWLRTSASFTTVSGTSSYGLGTGAGKVGVTVDEFGSWCLNAGAFRNYPTATGNTAEVMMELEPDYDTWRNAYLFAGTRNTRTRPMVFNIGPDKSVNLGPVPDAGYTITADYFSAPVAMALDTDSPAIPARFHWLLVYKAMMLYGEYEAAPEVYQGGQTGWGRMYPLLEADQLEMIHEGDALA